MAHYGVIWNNKCHSFLCVFYLFIYFLHISLSLKNICNNFQLNLEQILVPRIIQDWRVTVNWLIWLEVEPGVVGDSSSLSSLSTGSSGMAWGRSSPRGPLTGVFLPPTPPSSSLEMANRGISMMAEQQRRRTVRGGLESLSVWDDSETESRFLRLQKTKCPVHYTMLNKWRMYFSKIHDYEIYDLFIRIISGYSLTSQVSPPASSGLETLGHWDYRYALLPLH